jgi:hypothetical protein
LCDFLFRTIGDHGQMFKNHEVCASVLYSYRMTRKKKCQRMILHQNEELSCQTVRPTAVQVPKIIHPLNVLKLLQFQR